MRQSVMDDGSLNQQHDVHDPIVLALDDEDLTTTTTRTDTRTTSATSQPPGAEAGSPIPAEDPLVSAQRPTPPDSPQKVVPVHANTERVPTPALPVHQSEAAPPPPSHHGVRVLQNFTSDRTLAVVQLKPTLSASATPSSKRARVGEASRGPAKRKRTSTYIRDSTSERRLRTPLINTCLQTPNPLPSICIEIPTRAELVAMIDLDAYVIIADDNDEVGQEEERRQATPDTAVRKKPPDQVKNRPLKPRAADKGADASSPKTRRGSGRPMQITGEEERDGKRIYFVERELAQSTYETSESLVDEGFGYLLSNWAQKTAQARVLRAARQKDRTHFPATLKEKEEEKREERGCPDKGRGARVKGAIIVNDSMDREAPRSGAHVTTSDEPKKKAGRPRRAFMCSTPPADRTKIDESVMEMAAGSRGCARICQDRPHCLG